MSGSFFGRGSQTKVPLLGSIPLLGRLFRSVDNGVRNREMVIFLTPHVIVELDEIDEKMKEPKKILQRIEESIGGQEQKDEDSGE